MGNKLRWLRPMHAAAQPCRRSIYLKDVKNLRYALWRMSQDVTVKVGEFSLAMFRLAAWRAVGEL